MLDKPYYTIGETSQLCDIPAKTLRYYDSIGLMVPQHRDVENNYRYYTKDQLTTILIIKNLRRFGFNLKDIARFLSSGDPQFMEVSIREKLDEKRLLIEEMVLQYTEGQYFLQRMQKGIGILKQHNQTKRYAEDALSVEAVEGIQLFFNRREMKNYQNAEMSLDRWRDILAEADQKKLKVCGPIYVTFLNNNPLDKFLLQDSLVEFAVQVEETGSDTEFRTLECPMAVTAIHIGPYSLILNTYIKIINWIKANHYVICDFCTEEFIISPLDVVDESRHITRVIVPVKKEEPPCPCGKKGASKNNQY